MENTKKMTSKVALDYVLTNCKEALPEDVEEKLTAMREALDKKSNGERKMTADQKKNLELMEVVAEALTAEPTTPTDIMKKINRPEAFTSTQKITPLLTKLTEAGRAKKSVIKGRTHYSAVAGE